MTIEELMIEQKVRLLNLAWARFDAEPWRTAEETGRIEKKGAAAA
ncbi:MAG: hypothetical protein WEC75_13850 [Dehalococcoidia bacterium]